VEFIEKFGPVVWVTIGYVGVYYLFLVNVLRVKVSMAKSCRANGTQFDRYLSVDPKLRAADRVQLNTLEHMPAFLVLLWLYAAVVDVSDAAILGWLYVILRAIYPIFMGSSLKRNIPMRLLINTFAGYLILAFMVGGIVYTML
jgi:uncharacterized MAPEG superfamily protein